MIDIESLRALCKNDTITLTIYAAYRLEERNIKFKSVKSAIMNGEIIEEYPSEQPYPRVLIFGYDEKNIPIHVVVGVGDWNIQIVTSYYPTIENWEADYKTRKVN